MSEVFQIQAVRYEAVSQSEDMTANSDRKTREETEIVRKCRWESSVDKRGANRIQLPKLEVSGLDYKMTI